MFRDSGKQSNQAWQYLKHIDSEALVMMQLTNLARMGIAQSKLENAKRGTERTACTQREITRTLKKANV